MKRTFMWFLRFIFYPKFSNFKFPYVHFNRYPIYGLINYPVICRNSSKNNQPYICWYLVSSSTLDYVHVCLSLIMDIIDWISCIYYTCPPNSKENIKCEPFGLDNWQTTCWSQHKACWTDYSQIWIGLRVSCKHH